VRISSESDDVDDAAATGEGGVGSVYAELAGGAFFFAADDARPATVVDAVAAAGVALARRF